MKSKHPDIARLKELSKNPAAMKMRDKIFQKGALELAREIAKFDDDAILNSVSVHLKIKLKIF